MVFPYMNMLYWVYLLAVLVLVASFSCRAGRPARADPLSPAGDLPRHRGSHWGITLMLVSLAIFIVAFTMGGLNYVTTVLQAALSRNDHDADAALGMGHLHGDDPGPARLPALLVSAVMMTLDLQVGTSFFMPAIVSMGEQTGTQVAARCCSSTCSGSSATPRSTSSRYRRSASSPT